MVRRLAILLGLSLLAAGPVAGAEKAPPQAARQALDRFADTVFEARTDDWTHGSTVHLATRPLALPFAGLCRVNQVIETFSQREPVQLDAFFRYRLLLAPDWSGAPALGGIQQETPDRTTVAGCKALTSSDGFFRAANDVDAWQGARLFALAMAAVNAGPPPWPLEVKCAGAATCTTARPFGAPRPAFLTQVSRARCAAGSPPGDGCYQIVLSDGTETWEFLVEGQDKPVRLRLLGRNVTVE